MVEHDNDDISRLLDRALSSYVPEGEPLGLPQRILGRIEQDLRSRRRRKWPMLVLAFASLCIVVTALIVAPGSRSSRERSAAGTRSLSASLSAEHHASKADLPVHEHRQATIDAPKTARRRLSDVSSASRNRRSLPKLNQFPTPTPLTNEERALLRLPAQDAARLFMDKQGGNTNPIHIEPLYIKPL